VGIGSYVKVKDVDRGIEFEVRIVASIEADPDKDLISNESPMGLALWGHKVGDIVSFQAPIGRIRYQILGIRK
jgi:transcription elongation factor GreA